MVDITQKNKLCKEKNCSTQGVYNFPSETNGLYCSKHSKDGMIDVVTKKCIFQNCNKKPNFNFENEKIALYCSEHSLDGMINIYSQNCIIGGCNISASYNYKEFKDRLYCAKHALKDMIDIVNRRCIIEGCDILAKYNLKGEKNVLYCAKHKLENMIHLYPTYCLENNCEVFPSFNYKGFSAKYCLKHKKDNMINVTDNYCKYCEKLASYNYLECTERLYCSSHKKIGMINLYSLKCKSDFCLILINNKNRYDGYCLQCFANLFPDEPRTINYCTKEKTIVKFILNNFPNYSWITNKIIEGGCSKRRPDMLLDLGSHIIIIEIDENQHILYDSNCENKRLEEISKDLYSRPIIILRFNPDEYNDKNGKKINSPWIYYKTKINIDKKKEEEWKNRLNELKNRVEYFINIKDYTNEKIEIIKLFYDF